MNLLAHMAVASRIDGAPGHLLGAALPDLASPVRARLTEPSGVESIDRGVRLHHRTDAVFHDLPWFLDLQTRLGRALRTEGVGRGAARASAHVGVELLLDGALEADPHLDAAADAALAVVETHRGEIASMAAPASTVAWDEQLDRIVGARRPRHGLDPDDCAARLERICARRPRLAFAAGERDVVARVLSGVVDEIDGTAEAVVDDVLALL